MASLVAGQTSYAASRDGSLLSPTFPLLYLFFSLSPLPYLLPLFLSLCLSLARFIIAHQLAATLQHPFHERSSSSSSRRSGRRVQGCHTYFIQIADNSDQYANAYNLSHCSSVCQLVTLTRCSRIPYRAELISASSAWSTCCSGCSPASLFTIAALSCRPFIET